MPGTRRAAPAQWFLTHTERGNPWSRLDGLGPGNVAWSEGNLAHPLIDGAEYFPRLVAELSDVHAGDQVYLSAWIVDQDKRLDGSGTTMRAQFARVLREGASVHALLWWPYLDLDHDLVSANRDFASSLREMGASVVLDQRVRPAGCHHQKFLVIRRPRRPETDIAFVGGIDPCPSRLDEHEHRGDGDVQHSIDNERFGERPAWHDAHLQVRGPRSTTSSTASGNAGWTPRPACAGRSPGSGAASAPANPRPRTFPNGCPDQLAAARTRCSCCAPTRRNTLGTCSPGAGNAASRGATPKPSGASGDSSTSRTSSSGPRWWLKPSPRHCAANPSCAWSPWCPLTPRRAAPWKSPPAMPRRTRR